MELNGNNENNVMQIIYTCPNCGGDLSEIMVATNPPIYTKVCHNCGWSVEELREKVVRIPYQENVVLKTQNMISSSSISDSFLNNEKIKC